jgi:hypothetical protein
MCHHAILLQENISAKYPSFQETRFKSRKTERQEKEVWMLDVFFSHLMGCLDSLEIRGRFHIKQAFV